MTNTGDDRSRQNAPRPKPSPHFFRREPDSTVRLRIRFTDEEASMIEEAAGKTPLLVYIHRVLRERAKFHISKARLSEGYQPYPEEVDSEEDQ